MVLAETCDVGLGVERVDFDLVYCWSDAGVGVEELLELFAMKSANAPSDFILFFYSNTPTSSEKR